jgi:nucleotide-binding universal stress UspA family protein
MYFKTILVNLNNEPRAAALIAAATAIARPAQAHVIGLYVMPPLFMPSDVIMPMGADFYEEQVGEHRAQFERIKAVFDRLTKGEPYTAEWRTHGDARSAYEPIAVGVIDQSRATDIAERVALESGRPVLVVPGTWKACEYGRNVAVAWNDSREAARAAFDALPLLRLASKVRLLTVGEPANGNGKNIIPGAEMAATLARHGLDVDVETITNSDRHAGDAMLARVAADGADLLVRI